ncbi:MAG: PEP-CTERM sorting domain-containing protein [Acidobacteria bacterium]|nr:PEP-CTERM sorting domain-containing protein [Acidobacteriota bacterium]
MSSGDRAVPRHRLHRFGREESGTSLLATVNGLHTLTFIPGTQVVPEPSTYAPFGAGLVLVAWRRCRVSDPRTREEEKERRPRSSSPTDSPA